MTKPHDLDELLPCPTPWCDKWTKPYVFERRKDILGVCCPVCGVSTPYFATEEAAVALWNTRASGNDGEEGMSEREIIAAGQKLAAQMGWVFTVDPRRLADFHARAAALRAREGEG